jgi:hypothetical protein
MIPMSRDGEKIREVSINHSVVEYRRLNEKLLHHKLHRLSQILVARYASQFFNNKDLVLATFYFSPFPTTAGVFNRRQGSMPTCK